MDLDEPIFPTRAYGGQRELASLRANQQLLAKALSAIDAPPNPRIQPTASRARSWRFYQSCAALAAADAQSVSPLLALQFVVLATNIPTLKRR